MDPQEFTTHLAGGSYYRTAHDGLLTGHPITVMCDPCGKNTGNNHDDANALAVYNARGELIGYIPKQWAQMLGPAVLQNAIRVDGKITWHGGPSNVHLKCRIEPLIKPAEQVIKT